MLSRGSIAARMGICSLVTGFLCNCTALGHVTLDSPTLGQTLSGGFVFPIEWHPAIQHNTLDWDLWYSTTSSNGPWIEIASDLPVGDPTAGAPHSYDWYVDNIDASAAWVRVRQDNAGQDYYDVNALSFQIEEATAGDFSGNKLVNESDLAIWEDNFGTASDAFFSEGDADFDGDVDGADFLTWQENSSNQAAALVSSAIPEPSTIILLLLSLVGLMTCRRL